MKMSIGTTHNGVVVRKERFGVFVSIPGLHRPGLVHVSRLRGNSQELRNERLRLLEVGAEMAVEISDIQKEGKVTKFSLSEKRVHDDLLMHHLPLNEAISGVVTAKSEFGAFVTLAGWHVSGLLHFSRMSGATRNAQSATLDKIAVGDHLTVFVVEIQLEKDILKLKLSQTGHKPEDVETTYTTVDEHGLEETTVLAVA